MTQKWGQGPNLDRIWEASLRLRVLRSLAKKRDLERGVKIVAFAGNEWFLTAAVRPVEEQSLSGGAGGCETAVLAGDEDF